MVSSLIVPMASSLIQPGASSFINAIAEKGAMRSENGQKGRLCTLPTMNLMKKVLWKGVTRAVKDGS